MSVWNFFIFFSICNDEYYNSVYEYMGEIGKSMIPVKKHFFRIFGDDHIYFVQDFDSNNVDTGTTQISYRDYHKYKEQGFASELFSGVLKSDRNGRAYLSDPTKSSFSLSIFTNKPKKWIYKVPHFMETANKSLFGENGKYLRYIRNLVSNMDILNEKYDIHQDLQLDLERSKMIKKLNTETSFIVLEETRRIMQVLKQFVFNTFPSKYYEFSELDSKHGILLREEAGGGKKKATKKRRTSRRGVK